MFSLSPFTCPFLFSAQAVVVTIVMYVIGHEGACIYLFIFVCVFVRSCMCLCVSVCSQLQAGYFKLVATIPLRFGWLKAPSAL